MNLIIDGKKDIDFNFILENPIAMPVSEMNTAFTNVDGRDGSVHEDLGLQDITFSAVLNLFTFNDVYNDVSKMVAALFNAKEFTTDTWPFIFKKKHISWSEIANEMGVTAKIQINVRCHPLKFLKNSPTQSFTAAGTVKNTGTYSSKPLLKLYAKDAGASSVTLNGTKFTMNMQKEYVFVDCELLDAYYTTTNMNRFMLGSFPTLKPGDNNLTFDGAIAKIEIEPRCCNL